MKLEYVFSAPSMLKIQPNSFITNNPDEYKIFVKIVTECVRKVQKDLCDTSGFDIDINVLFNAFTESRYGDQINKWDRFGFKHLYADSGGLQMVTLGKAITPELKKKVYEIQSKADFAMCFDDIPLRSISNKVGKNSRTETGSKMFFEEDFERCAIETANNINEQCKVISSLNDTTKIFYIVQGNTHDHMVKWFEKGTSILDDYSRIGGIALADTCIGNGQLESIEMFMAYNQIRELFGEEKTKNHIHLLGVGSVDRLMPLFYCADTLLPKDLVVSFDSTKHSCSYTFGHYMHGNGPKVYDYKKYFTEILSYYEDILAKHYNGFDKKTFIDHCVTHIMSAADTVNKAPNNAWYVALAIITSTIVYQLKGFFSRLQYAVKQKEFSDSPMRHLNECNTYDDAKVWLKTYKKYVVSKRIAAFSYNLDEFFA